MRFLRPVAPWLILGLHAAPAAAVTVTEDVTYCSVIKDLSGNTIPTIDLKMNIAVPDGTGPFPAIVLIHGGQYQTGNRGDLDGVMMQAANQHGYVAATVSYRLSSLDTLDDNDSENDDYQVGAKGQAALNDVRCAIRFLRANASTYNVDTTHIGAAGEDVGGTMAVMLATANVLNGANGTNLTGAFQYSNPYSSPSSRANAAVAWYAPMDLTSAHDDSSYPILSQAVDNLIAFLGASPGDFNATTHTLTGSKVGLAEDLSPVNYVDSTDSSFKVYHATGDRMVPYGQATTMLDLYTAASLTKMTLSTVNADEHEFTDEEAVTYLADSFTYLDSKLK